MSLDFSRLPHEFPRKFLPQTVNLAEQDSLEQIFDRLEKREVASPGDLEHWLMDEAELAQALSEEQASRYVRMTCQTDDAEREKAYLFFIENIEPLAKVRFSNLDKKYLSIPARKSLPQDRYFVLDRKIQNNDVLFRVENVELEKEEAKLAQAYEKTTGAMSVMYEGKERNMQQLAKYLDEVNRKLREETWLLGEERRQKDREALDKLYDQLIELRQKIAENAGFENYRDYIFPKKERFDYTPQDCIRYHEAVEKYIVPLVRQLDEERKKGLGVDPLRPFDMSVDPKNRPALRPFSTAAELIQGCTKIFDRVDPEFGRKLRRMTELKLLDLDSRKGKAPGGYNMELAEARVPFIFMNAVGRDGDVWTLLHEAGHAFQTFATREANLPYYYRGDSLPLEIAEVASQGMEIIAGEHLEESFYSKQDAARSRREHFATIVTLLAWIATIDAFQHWVYTNPGHSHEAREEQWLKLRKKFGGLESWEGYENYQRSRWQRQLHLYIVPFYYIEYGISLLGALGLWTRYRKDPKAAVAAYKKALPLGGSKPLPELYKAADLPFDFGPNTVGPYARELRQVLKEN